jgi:hypothetical protein
MDEKGKLLRCAVPRPAGQERSSSTLPLQARDEEKREQMLE